MASHPIVSMNPEGRLTIPANTRKQLRISGETQFEIEVRGETILLRPVVVLPREDAWAYTPEHRRLLERAHQDSREGRVQQLTEDALERLVE